MHGANSLSAVIDESTISGSVTPNRVQNRPGTAMTTATSIESDATRTTATVRVRYERPSESPDP